MSPVLLVTTVCMAALVGSSLAAPAARSGLLARGIVDRPNERSSHRVSTVRGGGTGFVAVIVLLLGAIAFFVRDLEWMAILAAAAALAVVSFVDDVRGLGARIRLLVHALAAAPLAAMVFREPPGGAPVAGSVLAVVTLVGVVGHTNAFNFMDGIDGIASCQAALASAGTAAVLVAAGAPPTSTTVLAALVVGCAVLGFLPWNFPRARMFMGDVGSATLGYLLAALVVRGVIERGFAVLLPLALIHAGFVLDTAITFVRRLSRGERVSQAHREHFYQRLVRSGLPHAPVTGLYAAATAVSVVVAVVIVGRRGAGPLGGGALVVGLWLVIFAFAERRFRRAR